MYHVIANLELMFDSLSEALAWAESRPEFKPRVPATAMCGEDRTTPRVCGAPTVEDCITAIGIMGTFRRCLNADEDAKSYENDNEAYPVLIAEFNGEEWTKPSRQQVPDVSVTHEHWLLRPARPVRIELKWLNAYSLKMRDAGIRMACTRAAFLEDASRYDHPWLNGKGHPLDSSDMGGDPWPDGPSAASEIYLDSRLGGHIGFAMPRWPFDGSWLFTPLDGTPPYRTYPRSLKRFTGLYDMDGEPVFEGYVLKWGPDSAHRTMGEVRYDGAAGWHIMPWGPGGPMPLPGDGSDTLPGMYVHIGHTFDHEIVIPEIFKRKDEPSDVPCH